VNEWVDHMAYSIEECRERGLAAGAWAASIFNTGCVGKDSDVVSAWVSTAMDALEIVKNDMRAAGTSDEALKWYLAAWMAEIEPVVTPEMDRIAKARAELPPTD
jgi:hypothetical protein